MTAVVVDDQLLHEEQLLHEGRLLHKYILFVRKQKSERRFSNENYSMLEVSEIKFASLI